MQKSHRTIRKRDKIKIEVIKQCGYIPYIIKDEGKFSMKKVNEEFESFKIFLISHNFKDFT